MSRFIMGATWEMAPHLTVATREALYGSYQPYQRDARTRGIPQLGAGAVYQIPESEIRVESFKIPDHWPRAWGGDTDQGEGETAAVWGAQDPDSKVIYLYDCYKRKRQPVLVNAAAIKARGADIPGVMDAAALQTTPDDAVQLVRLYRAEGLTVSIPDKSVEAGIEQVWHLMMTGRLKVFASLGPWFAEFRLYRRDERGRIVKRMDHLLDATRYLIRSGMKRAQPVLALPEENTDLMPDERYGGGDMGGMGWAT